MEKAISDDRVDALEAMTDPEQLSALAGDSVKEVRWIVAENPHTPPDALASLALDKDNTVRLAVAMNPSTTAGALGILSKDQNYYVRARVAEHANVTPELLADLAKIPRLQSRVVANPKVTQETLRYIATKVSTGGPEAGRLAVAGCGRTGAEVLDMLATDWSPAVRQAVAANGNTPMPTVRFLFKKERTLKMLKAISENALAAPEILDEAAKTGDCSERKFVAGHPRTSLESILLLARDTNPDVRAAVPASRLREAELTEADNLRMAGAASTQTETWSDWAARTLSELQADVKAGRGEIAIEAMRAKLQSCAKQADAAAKPVEVSTGTCRI